MNKKPLKVGKILGIGISSTEMSLVLKKVASDIKRKKKILIVTPNPEIVLKAQNDSLLLSILNGADIATADGIGLIAASKFLSLPNPKDKLERFCTIMVQGLGVGFSVIFNRKWLTKDLKPLPGRNLAVELIGLASRQGLKLFLLGGEGGEGRRSMLKIKKQYPGIKIDSFQGPMLDTDAIPLNKKEERIQSEAVKRIKRFAPDILLVGMSSPRQEKWLYRWLPKINVTVGLTVGGTFKYLSGDTSLPPSWFDDHGLSWVYRLAMGDQKVKRVVSAVWTFPLKVFWYKFTH